MASLPRASITCCHVTPSHFVLFRVTAFSHFVHLPVFILSNCMFLCLSCLLSQFLTLLSQSVTRSPTSNMPTVVFIFLACLFTCVPSPLFRFLPLSHITSFVFLLLILRCSAMHKQCMYDVLTPGNLRFDWKY